MTNQPADAVALVTGGSGAIGAATCRALAAAGQIVLVGYRSNPELADAVVASLDGKGETIHIDVTDTATIEAAVARAGELGTLATLVNNAGVADDDLLLRLDADRIDQTLAVNLRGSMLCAKAAIRPMMRARYGRIVSVSSVVALRGNAGQTLYAAAKAGLHGMTRSLAREVARKGVTVNVVAPGFVASEMTAGLSDAARDHLVSLAPIGRAVEADEVADAIRWLTSPGAGAITGVVVPVDGGAGI